MPIFGKAGIETLDDAKKFLREFWNETAKPAVDHWIRGTKTYMSGTLDRIRDNDAKKIVEDARDVVAPMIRDAGTDILKQVKDNASGIGERLVAGAEKGVNTIIERSVKTTIADARTLLSKESPLVAGMERAIEKADRVAGNVTQAIERAQNLVPHLRKLTGIDDPAVAKGTMESFKKTTQDLKEMVLNANRLLPQVNVVLKEWHAEKERERQFNWRVVLGSTAAGLLLVTFAYAVYLKLGLRVTPIRAISLFWLGISVPIIVVNLWAFGVLWKTARDEGMASEVYKRIFTFKNAAKFVVLIVLVAANLILNLWL